VTFSTEPDAPFITGGLGLPASSGIFMTTFKDILCLLLIFVAYGIAGHMDYEDAVALEQIDKERDRLVAECPAIEPEESPAGDWNAAGRFIPASQAEPDEPCRWPEP
jgi:hypothetical protein